MVVPWRLVKLAGLMLVAACAAQPATDIEQRLETLPVEAGHWHIRSASAGLRLLSLNLAHGRKDSLNQLLVGKKTIRSNLDDIAEFLRQQAADVVALQEADGSSRWSGDFDHVAYLAQAAGYPYYVHTEHAQLWLGNYGTAILSRLPITSALGLTFPPSLPTASKGLTLAQLSWDRGDSVELLDVVSVHLDFSRKSVRQQQLDELVSVLKPRQQPLVIMGDFNSEWLAETYLVDSFADASRLHVYQAASEDLQTYKDKRLDWILLSRRLQFDSYRSASKVLSDHRAVIADIRLIDNKGESR